MPSRQHLRCVKQNIVAPSRKGSKLYAATPRSNSISRRRSSRFTTWNAPWRICVLKFAYFVISVARSVNSTVRSTTRKYYHFVSDFQFNSRIVVENCVVGICNNGVFLEFHEFETKYLAGVHKRH